MLNIKAGSKLRVKTYFYKGLTPFYYNSKIKTIKERKKAQMVTFEIE